MYQDNSSSITMNTSGGGSFRRSKHMIIRNYFITEQVNNGHIKQVWLNTLQMSADGGTKPKWGSAFATFLTSLYMK
jgi:hypothetical protein